MGLGPDQPSLEQFLAWLILFALPNAFYYFSMFFGPAGRLAQQPSGSRLGLTSKIDDIDDEL